MSNKFYGWPDVLFGAGTANIVTAAVIENRALNIVGICTLLGAVALNRIGEKQDE